MADQTPSCIHVEHLNVPEQLIYCSRCHKKLAHADERRYPGSPSDTPVILYEYDSDGKVAKPLVIDSTTGLLITAIHA